MNIITPLVSGWPKGSFGSLSAESIGQNFGFSRPFGLLAERHSFVRKMFFRQKEVSFGNLVATFKWLSYCQKTIFLPKVLLSVLSVFRQKPFCARASLSVVGRKMKFLFRSPTTSSAMTRLWSWKIHWPPFMKQYQLAHVIMLNFIQSMTFRAPDAYFEQPKTSTYIAKLLWFQVLCGLLFCTFIIILCIGVSSP